MILKLLGKFILFIAAPLLWSCSTELDVNAPYRETKVLYGILDPTQPYQVFRIGKGFLSDGIPATEIAKNYPDSSLFRPSNLEVSLYELKQNSSGSYDTVKKEILSDTIIGTKEDDGDFFSGDQLIFKTKSLKVSGQMQYLIRVRNKISGKISEAFTQVPGGNLEVTNSASFIDLPTDPYRLDFAPTKSVVFRISKPVNTAVMELNIRWKFIVELTSGEERVEFWEQRTGPDNELLGSVKEFKFGPGSFWNFIQGELTKRGNIGVKSRTLDTSSIELYAGNYDYDNYRVVNGNYNAITQSQPVYSNISNGGLGIFCARNRKVVPKPVFLRPEVIQKLRESFPDLKLQ